MVTKPVIVLGAGGYSQVLIDVLKSQGISIAGIIDLTTEHCGETVMGVPIIGDDNLLLQHRSDGVLLVNGIGRVGRENRRQSLFELYKRQGYNFIKVIHPRSIIAREVELSEGVQIMAGAIIQPMSSVGINTIINTGATVDHHCIVGAHVHIAPGVTISGGVRIGNGVMVGAGATIIQGINVGDNSIIAAGAVVIRDIPIGVTAMGVPAKVAKL